jgi:hypothetical protein
VKFQIGQVYHALATCSSCEHGATTDGPLLICGNNGEPVCVFDMNYACPDGKWRPQPTGFLKVPGSTPPVPHKSVWEKAAEFVKTATSGFATDAVVALRMSSCASCDKLQSRADGNYCGACGCPEWALSKLDKKVRFRDLPCPHPDGPRKGFANS